MGLMARERVHTFFTYNTTVVVANKIRELHLYFFVNSQVSQFNHQPVVSPTDCRGQPATEESYARQEANMIQETASMDAYIDKFSPAGCPSYPVGPGYCCVGGGPFARRGPSILPEVDLARRPGSLQEAICMYIDFLLADNEMRTRISECAVASPAPPLDFHREDYYRDVMCRPVNFPTARFRDWLKRYNVDIEITDPDGQTVSQTTFAPVAPVAQPPSDSPHPGGTDGDGWVYADGGGPPVVVQRRRLRPSTARTAVICQPPPPPLPHALLHLEPDPVAVQMLSSSTDVQSVQTHPMNFTPAPSAAGAPVPSPVYQSQAPPDPAEPRVPLAAGCGYGSSPGEDENDECKEEPACTGSELPPPVSGWPDVSLEQPRPATTTSTTAGVQDLQQDAPDQPLSGCTGDAYFQGGGTADCRGGQFASGCFEPAPADGHRTSGDCLIDVDQGQLDQVDPAPNLTRGAQTSSGHGQEIHHAGAFPVVIEPTSPSSRRCATASSIVVQDFTTCFDDSSNNDNDNDDHHVGAEEYQLAYVEAAGSDEELSADAQLSDAAAPETTASLGRSTVAGPTSCLDLAADFADLLGSQHSDEFDYHLNYANAIDSSPRGGGGAKDSEEDSGVTVDRRSQRARGPACRATRTTRTYPKSTRRATAAGPASKAARREPAAHR